MPTRKKGAAAPPAAPNAVPIPAEIAPPVAAASPVAAAAPPKPRRRAAAPPATPAEPPAPAPVAAHGGPAAPVAGADLDDPDLLADPALPAFLRDRAARPAPPAVRILGADPAPRPTVPANAPATAPPPPAPAVPRDRYEVYALGDRAADRVYYIGLSDDHDRRLRQHINAAVNPRSLWLQQLIVGQGRRPAVKVIGRYPTLEAAKAAEEAWIGLYRADGHPLTNALTARERRTAREAGTPPEKTPAPAPRAVPPAPAHPGPPPPTRHPIPRAWLMSVGVAVLLSTLVVWGLGWSPLAPSGTPARTGAPVGAAGYPTAVAPPDVRPIPTAPADLPVDQGALVPPSPTQRQRLGSHSVTVQPGQTLTDVALALNQDPAALAAQLGRTTVYAGEVVTWDLYAGDPVAAPRSQGGGPTVEPTVDVHTGKGPDAPIPPVIETTVLASTGLCPPGSARAGQPRDGRVVVPFEPGCAPDDAGQVGPPSQPWVPGPSDASLAQGGGPHASLPATGHADSPLPGAADLLGAVADQAAATLEQSAPEPVTYCADGSVRDLVHRMQAPFVPGCAPLPVGPPAP